MSSTASSKDPSDPTQSMSDVALEEMLATRLRVSGVTVRGTERTRQAFVEYIVAPVVHGSKPPEQANFESVVEDVSVAVDRLRSTGCFKGVDAFLDRDPLDDAAAHVTFTLAEKSLYQVRTGTSVETTGDREASIDAAILWRNVFGRTETLSVKAGWWGSGTGQSKTFGEAPSNSLELEFMKPFFPVRSTGLYARAGQTLRNHEDWSSYSVNTRSAEIGVDTPMGRFAYQSAWRHLCDVGDTASMLVRDDVGHSLKSSLLHSIFVDGRDNPVMPTEGYAAGLETELAGFAGFGNVRFGKFEASMQYHVPIGASGIAVALSLRSGMVATPEKDGKVLICDRFHVGGANSLRGFRPRGVGPRDGNDALGGETFYTATAMISAPAPEGSLLSQLFGARVHAFATAGDVGHMTKILEAVGTVRKDGRRGLKDVATTVANTARVAVGVGIAGETPLGRIELNLCNAVRSSAVDRPKTGVQFGLSQSFM